MNTKGCQIDSPCDYIFTNFGLSLSCTKLSVCHVSTREALSVLHKTGGKDGSLNTSCSMAPIKKPASATSFSVNASDAKGI